MSLTTSPTKRQQVISVITESIHKGELNHGDRLATVRDMCNYFAVSSSVIQAALREMQGNGLIECRGASGFYVNTPGVEARAGINAGAGKKAPCEGEIYLSALHHSDLLWRRTSREYDRIRARQIELVMDYCRRYPEFRLIFDQSEVVRRYLEEYPEKTAEFKELVRRGQFTLIGGMCIPDLNMISGESLVRNLLEGRDYFRDVFNVEPEGASMVDAFGMSAQLPQVLRLAGYRWLLPGRMPGLDPDISMKKPLQWQGLDGSRIVVAPPEYFVMSVEYLINVPTTRSVGVSMAKSMMELKKSAGNVLALYMTEEHLLEEDLFWIIDSVNRTGGRQIKFGSINDFFAAIGNSEMPVFTSEFNPTLTGCYTTRIEVKQRNRRSENLLCRAEFMDALAGGGNDFKPLRHQLHLTQFHDGICGCHTDAVNAELAGYYRNIEAACTGILNRSAEKLSGGGITVFNCDNRSGKELVEIPAGRFIPEGKKVQRHDGKDYFCTEVTPCGYHGLKAKEGQGVPGRVSRERIIRTPYYEADFSGTEPVIRSLAGPGVIGSDAFGEILIRDDSGSMWTESPGSPNYGREYQKSKVERVIAGDVFSEAVISGRALPPKPIPGFKHLKFTKTYTFYHELDYFKLKIELDFSGCNTRTGIRFPVNLDMETAAATYSIPFGSLVRKPYFEVPSELESTMRFLKLNEYNSAKGDYPALDWVDYSDVSGGLAVANTGTPGHQMVGDSIYVSLLRSGTLRADGQMVPDPGAYDNGRRVYEFAFCVHRPDEMDKAPGLGRKLNLPPLAFAGRDPVKAAAPRSLLSFQAPNVMISALFGDTVRLFETLGRSVTVRFRTDFDLYEAELDGRRVRPLPEKTVRFAPFEIKTLKLGDGV